MHKLHVVIPVGVSSPGTPIPEFLLNGIESLKSQTLKDILITVAADENISDVCKQILKDTNVNIEWFPEYSYFTKEGIWGKIVQCWEKYDSEYVSFLHYDDHWESNKALAQIDFIEQNNLDGCWSKVYLINDDNEIISGDSMAINKLSEKSVGHLIPWICHSTIIKKDTILNCGILEYREKWNCDFEWLYTAFLHKIKNLKKCENAIFLWRQHINQVSHNQGVNMKEDTNHVQEQRKLAGYTLNEAIEDSKYVMENVDLEAIKQLYIANKCCTIITTHAPKFKYAIKFLETFYKYNIEDHDVYFVFTNEQEYEAFSKLSPYPFYGLILSGELRDCQSIVNVKKYYALNILVNRYDYIGVYDCETEIVKEVNLNYIYKDIYERKILKCNISTFEHFPLEKNFTQYLVSKLNITPNQELQKAIDSKYYWWFNEIPVYESKSFKKFYKWFSQLENLKDIQNDYWCFDYMMYSIWLVVNENFKFTLFDTEHIWGAVEEFRMNIDEKDILSNTFKSYWDTNSINHSKFPHIKLLIHTDVNPVR